MKFQSVLYGMSFFLLLSCNGSNNNLVQNEHNKTEIISSNENDGIVIAEINDTTVVGSAIDYLFELSPNLYRDQVSSILPKGEKSDVFPDQIEQVSFLKGETHEIKVRFDEDKKITSFTILVDTGLPKDKELSKKLVNHASKKYGKPSLMTESEFEDHYEWKLNQNNLESFFEVKRKDGYVEYAYLELDKKIEETQQITEQDWGKFVKSIYSNDPDFDWFEHGANDKNQYIYYSDYFNDDYVKQVLHDSSLEVLADDNVDGIKTKTLPVVFASSGEIVGNVLHFIKQDGKIKLVAIEPYNP